MPATENEEGNGRADGELNGSQIAALQASTARLNGRAKSSAPKHKNARSFHLALNSLELEPIFRAADPFGTHAWVYAGAMAIALNLSQAPFLVFEETDDEAQRRAAKAIKRGKPPRARAGRLRTAVQRHLLTKIRAENFYELRALEPALDHDLAPVFRNPNDLQSGRELWQVTAMWMALAGEAFWILTGPDMARLGPNETPTNIWALSPRLFEPWIRDNALVGWQFSGSTSRSHRLFNSISLEMHEVVQFKFPNPHDPLRGFSPLSPVANGISTDLAIEQHNRALLENNAEPGGIFMSEEAMDPDEEEKFRNDWNERHQGPRNRRRIEILTGIKFVPTAFGPEDMQFQEQRRWNREEILAVMGVPKSVVAVTEGLNFAIQRSQDFNFWDKRLLPMIRIFEDTVDQTVFFKETDNIVGAFDLSGVEALREGTSAKIEQATQLASPPLHMPPDLAYRIVGLAVPEYEGGDVALVPPLLAPAEDVAGGFGGFPDAQFFDQDRKPSKQPRKQPRRVTRSLNRWRELIEQVQIPSERKFRRAWRQWVRERRDIALAAIDALTDEANLSPLSAFALAKQSPEEIEGLLEELDAMRGALRSRVRPVYSGASSLTIDSAIEGELGGVSTFETDDPRFLQVIDDAEKLLVDSTSNTLRNQVLRTVRMGVQEGETIGEIRARVARVFDIAASSSKTLQVARTASASFMNRTRNTVFSLSGIEERNWQTAGDEVVREDHVAFGNAGAHDAGFNWLDVVGKAGILEYPTDPRAPADQVINCRCVEIPA